MTCYHLKLGGGFCKAFWVWDRPRMEKVYDHIENKLTPMDFVSNLEIEWDHKLFGMKSLDYHILY